MNVKHAYSHNSLSFKLPFKENELGQNSRFVCPLYKRIQYTPARTDSIRTWTNTLENTIFELKMMVKNSVIIFFFKFHEPL